MYKSTLTGLSLTEAETYCTQLLELHPRGTERKQIFAFLSALYAKDKVQLKKYQFINAQLGSFISDKAVAHGIDYERHNALFVASTLSDADLITYLSQPDAEVFLQNKTITGNITLGDDAYLQGFSTGSAKDSTLASTGKIVGNLTIAGNNVVIKGVHIESTADKSIKFSGNPQNLVIQDCVFDMGGFTKFFYGNGFGGSLTIKNCWVKNIGTHWYFMDVSTDSSVPLTKLDEVLLDSNYFDGVTGNIASRGKIGDPNNKVSYINNKLRFATPDPAMWDVFEANCTKIVIVTGNEVSGLPTLGTVLNPPVDVGLLQTWSKSGIWTLIVENNSIYNVQYVAKIAMSTNFYSPDHATSVVRQGTGVLANVVAAASFVYPWLDPVSNYNPVNVGAFPSPIAVDFPSIP
jgi:hypothetical protein